MNRTEQWGDFKGSREQRPLVFMEILNQNTFIRLV